MTAQQDSGESVIDLLDALESAVATGRRVPFTPQVVVNEADALDLIDRARRALPDDIKVARQVLETRAQLLQEAEEAAGRLRTQAEADVAALIAAADAEARQRVDAGGAEADRMVHEARGHALGLIADHAVTREAEAGAVTTRAAADEDAQRLRADAEVFVRELLTGADAAVERARAQLRRAVEALPPR